MKNVLDILSSMKTMALLMLIFAVAIGYATFIENDYGIMSAKAEVYNAKWFELLLSILSINLILNIYNYKMFTLKQAPLFLFHVAFLIIIFGAAVTRYVGFEGSMHIRENNAANTMLSSATYFMTQASFNGEKVEEDQAIFLSKRSSNSLESSLNIGTKQVEIKLTEYIPDVIQSYVEDKKEGAPIIEMMVAANGSGESVILKKGMFRDNGEYIIDFGSQKTFKKPVISLFVENEQLFMSYDISLAYLKMDGGDKGELQASKKEAVVLRTLFSKNNSSFVLKKFLPFAKSKMVSNPNASSLEPGYDALVFLISVDDKSETVTIIGRSGVQAKPHSFEIDDVTITLSYGSKILHLPFSIYLKDFQLERYPGSMSPSSYASEVVLLDKEQNLTMPYRIFMNNILEHRGYRFFQASYDQDEKGTVLSVNNDPGTLPSYIGYFLLAVGMFWSLFSKQHRFAALAKRAKKASLDKGLSVVIALGLLGTISSLHAEELDPVLKTIISFDKTHASKFGKLIIQDSGGRMKPINTLSTEIFAKIYGASSLTIGEYKLSPTQVILGMMIRPDAYKQIKIIKTKQKDINKLIGARENAKYASFSQFFQDPVNMRGYKLAQMVEESTRKQPKYRNKLDKAVLKVDERVNVSYMVYTGGLIKMWPKKNDVNNKWLATINALQTMSPEESLELRNIAIAYFTSVDASLSSGDWSKANEALVKIAEYQKFYGAAVYPSQTKISAEVFYNEAKIFERIYPFYLLIGFILLILSFVKILRPSFQIDLFLKVSLALIIVLFIAHTIGLANRWYISGHAPWSDGYESMIYISWSTVLAGFIFSKRSSMTMASTGILTGLILFVAHLNWMNPQVTNLVPVLNSYWLSIHVSMITASYGFLGLGALLGFITLILFVLKNEKNEKHIVLSIKELNAINEMSLMVGLVLLTVGNFLGGVWANESWGRYWGWDPKETWALVTILVYAVVVHLRFIKSLYSEFSYSVISLLSFTSVLMTYFGVNYYLAGLHSYGKGDPVPIPDFVPVSYTIVFLLIALAYRNKKV